MGEVIVIQHEPDVPPGVVADVLDRHEVRSRTVHAWDDTEWPSLAQTDALVVLGGAMNVDETDQHPFLHNSRSLMRGALDNGVPTLGICLGSQMMARMLGAKVYRAPSRKARFAPVIPDPVATVDPVARPFATGIPVLQFHEDTFDLPAGTTRLFSNDDGLVQGFRYEGFAYALQFHPEVSPADIVAWCDAIGPEELAEEWGTTKEQLMAEAGRYLNDQKEAGFRSVEEFLRVAGILKSSAAGSPG